MDSGELTARDWATGQPSRLRWEGGVITCLESAAAAPEDEWFAPPLCDLQINGYAGVDFQRDGLTEDDLLRAVRGLRTDGCASFLLTLITDDWRRLTARLQHLAALRTASPELRSAIVGWHVEGPFLSAEPGFHGAHDPQFMRDPIPEAIRELRAITGNDALLLTLAPERAGALDAIRLAVSLGIKVSLGHTDASAEMLAQAVRAGATMFTHLANGCPRTLDRHDNILWRVFETPGLTTSLIPDGIHVSPAPFRLIHRALNNSVYYTSDAMSAAGAPPGTYTLGHLNLEVGADQVVRQPGKTNFAGSALRPVDGVFRAAAMLKEPWPETWRRFSEIPARLMSLPHSLAVGRPANFCRLRINESQELQEIHTIWNG